MAYRFERIWNLSIQRNGVEVLSLTSENNDYRLVFTCSPYASLGEPSFLEVDVYNIGQSDYSKIRPGDSLILSVGYKTQGLGIIFNGQIYSFYGKELATQNSKDYIFSIYVLSYFGNGVETKPTTFSIPAGTISSQAAQISSYYGYRPGAIVLKSPSEKSSPALHFIANNMDDALLQFYRQTKYMIIFNSKTKSYYLSNSQPTKEEKQDIAQSVSASPSGRIIKIDDNTGMIGYPHADAMTGFIKVDFLIDPTINIFSKLSIDVSNAIIDNIKVTLSQEIISNLRLYKEYYVVSLSIMGDTRGEQKAWYQQILAIGL